MEYQKIPNIYHRESFGNNKLIIGAYTSDELAYLKDNEWFFTEKVDGTNIRVIWDGYRVEFRGRTDKAQIPKPLLTKLEELFGGESKEELFESTFGNKNVILYGEGYGGKIQGGGGYGDINFILFDARVEGWWLNRESVFEISNVFQIDIVPIRMHGTLEGAVQFIKSHPKSCLRLSELEGIVGQPVIPMYNRKGERIIVKIKCRDFPKEG